MRSVLRDGTWYARRGAIAVTVCAPIVPDGDDWAATLTPDVALAALHALAEEGQVTRATVGEAITRYGIDAARANPWSA